MSRRRKKKVWLKTRQLWRRGWKQPTLSSASARHLSVIQVSS